MAEEKERARAACAFASFKDHVTVELWAKALVEVAEVVDAPVLVQGLEVVDHVEGHSHALLDRQSVLLVDL
jgi:hypothetical protein